MSNTTYVLRSHFDFPNSAHAENTNTEKGDFRMINRENVTRNVELDLEQLYEIYLALSLQEHYLSRTMVDGKTNMIRIGAELRLKMVEELKETIRNTMDDCEMEIHMREIGF